MIKKIAWNTFKNTGDVNTFLELKQIENLEQQMYQQMPVQGQNDIISNIQQQTEEQNGDNQNEWYNNF